LFGELLVTVVTVDGILNCLDLISGYVARDIFAILPSLMVVVRAVGALAHHTKLAAFELRDMSHLLKERLRRDLIIHEDRT
jgi:hypothetical protein